MAPVDEGTSRERRAELPALKPRPGGWAERFAGRTGARHPLVAFCVALLCGAALLVVASGLSGLFVTHVLLHLPGVDRLDERVVEAVVAERTPELNRVSQVGSTVGGGLVLPIVAGVVALGAAALRRWRVAGYAALGLVLESATYRVTTLLVHRPRPGVFRLEGLPANASYPSGHTAASTAVYVGLAVLLASAVRRRALRRAIWAAAVLLVMGVAASRIYRGMHHPIDVLGGAGLGLGAVTVLLFACRTAGAIAAER